MIISVFVGADYPIATSLIAEFTPKHHRAISMGMVSAAWYLGATVAALVGYCLCDVDNGWKLMLRAENNAMAMMSKTNIFLRPMMSVR